MNNRIFKVLFVAAVLIAALGLLLWRGDTDPADTPVVSSETSSADHRATPSVADATDSREQLPRATPAARQAAPGAEAEAASNTFGCDLTAYEESRFGRFRTDEWELRMEELAQTLAASGDSELLLLSRFLGDTLPYAQHDLLVEAFTADPTNPLVLWQIADDCAHDSSLALCSDAEAARYMRDVLSLNGAYWSQMARYHYSQSDKEAALDALRRAATAPDFDHYFAETIRTYQRALTITPDVGAADRGFLAHTWASVHASLDTWGLKLICRTEAASDIGWLGACLTIAQRFETDAQSLIRRQFGHQLEAVSLEAAGLQFDQDAANINLLMLDQVYGLTDDQFAVFISEPRVVAAYLDELDASDEVAARQYLQEEVERLQQDPQYDPCPEFHLSGVAE